ncbi:MAG: Putative membrane-bound redox modulator Alx [Legionellaceae bacterium]
MQISEWWLWSGFIFLILATLTIDLLGFTGKKGHSFSTKEALLWTFFWFFLALLFNFFIWWYSYQTSGQAIATQKAFEFFTGYLIEKSLSIDNIFVFILIFNYFSIPIKYQRRILIFGVIGAILMRAIMIFLGYWLIKSFHWILYLFGLILVFTSIRMLLEGEKEQQISQNVFLIKIKKYFNIIDQYDGDKFFISKNGIRYVTPLFLALIMVEMSDLIFAIDSIPAIFAITMDPFIVFTSNIFAIMGLRALYFLLADIIQRFHLLKYGLSLILFFIGLKMLIAEWIKIPILLMLSIIIGTLTLFIGLSIYWPNKSQKLIKK